MEHPDRTTLAVALAAIALGGIGQAGCDGATTRDVPASEPAGPQAAASVEELTDALQDSDAFSRARRLGTLLPKLGPEAVAEVTDLLQDPALELSQADYELLVRFWALHEPANAAAWAFSQAPPGYEIAAAMPAVAEWAKADPEKALIAVRQWASAGIPATRVAQIALVQGWYEVGHPGLEQYIHDLGMGFERQRALAAYARAVIRDRGADALIEWAESIPAEDESYKLDVNRQVSAVLPLFDLDAALRWCEEYCEGPHGNGMRTMIARRWVRQDGAAALAWLWDAPEGKEKDLSIRVTYASWGRRDRQAAMDWMEARAPGGPESADELDPQVRSLIPIYARLVADDAPTEALAWAEVVEEEREREWTFIRVAQKWRAQDEAAAEAWLLQSPLSEESREQVRSSGRKKKGKARTPSG